MRTPLRGLPGLTPWAWVFYREITELQCHLNSLFSHVSYSNFSQQLFTESQDSIHLRKT